MKTSYTKKSRDPGGFIAIPWMVLDSPAYQGLSPHAKALLVDIARQYSGSNNGALRCGRAYMQPRGWNSVDMLTKAKRELLEAELLFETVKGCRPNKASWFALTWLILDKVVGLDAGAAAAFERGAYRKKELAKNASVKPSHGTESSFFAPPHGTGKLSLVPPHGAIRAICPPAPVPLHGHL